MDGVVEDSADLLDGRDLAEKLLPPNRLVQIEGRRIVLRPFSEDELSAEYLHWINDPEINRFLSTSHKKQSADDARNYINSLRSKPTHDLFAIISKKDDRHVGNISITPYDRAEGLAGYGIMIGDEWARENGLGGEASALMIEYYFSDPAIRKILGGAVSANVKAWKTMESLGYTREGVMREQTVILPEGPCDWYQYGMLRREWSQNKRVKMILKDMKVTQYSTD